jgi:OOP family OmpA-OmpF porin
MMNKIAKKSALLALIAGLGIGAVQAQEQVYVRSSGMVVKNATGLCWRTGYWTPAAAAKDQPAGCQCDPALMPAGVCGAKPAEVAPAAGPVIGGEKITLAADALFDFNKATLRPEGIAKLDDAIGKLRGLMLQVVLLVGHTDRIGTDAYNQTLSEKRAAAVKEYMVSKGVEANRIYTEGKGEKYPVTGDKCKGDKKTKALIDCLQPDRRVDVEIVANQPPKK